VFPPNDRELEAALGHVFSDRSLLVLALTHRSASGAANNERLEFLGDSVLGHVIADALYHRFPDAAEGQLTRARARMVNADALNRIAGQLGVGSYLRLGPGELKSGAWRRASILADALEALLGAILLDGGIEKARACVLTWYEPMLDGLRMEEVIKDPKTRLQEFLQGRGLPLPRYDVMETAGKAHEQRFRVCCSAEGIAAPVEAWGGSRRIAEQIAAEGMLAQLEPGGPRG
jgi:ribonuclease-3